MNKIFLLLGLSILLTTVSSAQMTRERSANAAITSEPFWATSVVITPSATQLPASNLNFTIQHAFGLVSDGLDGLYGLDASANIRFGLDYGITDEVSVGIGRSRFDKVVDVRAKARLATFSPNSQPTHVTIAGNVAMDTQKSGLKAQDKFSSFVSILMARSFNDQLTIQVAPSWSHFNAPKENVVFGGGVEREEGDIFSIGIAGRYAVASQVSILLEYLPVMGSRSDGSHDALSIGVDLETGGHVFQLYLTSTQWIVPQYVISKTRNRFSDGDFGFGFTVHRVF